MMMRRGPNTTSPAPTPAELDLSVPVYFHHEWSIWYDFYNGPSQSFDQFEANLYKLCSFDTVQTFWKWNNNLPPAKSLVPRSSLHVMRDGVRPLWEDPANCQGGTLTFKLQKCDTDAVWRQLMLSVLGEQLSPILTDGDEITGITVSIRRDMDVLSVWNRNADSLNINKLLEKIAELVPTAKGIYNPSYRVHRDHICNLLEKKP